MIKLKPIQQKSGFCGPASLSSLLGFYDVKMSQRELASLCNTSKDKGTEPGDLVRVLKNLGFNPVAEENGTWAKLENLIKKGIPVLVNWWSDFELPADGNYSLIYDINDESVSLMDPEIGGFRTISKDKFMNNWYNFYINGDRNERWFLYVEP